MKRKHLFLLLLFPLFLSCEKENNSREFENRQNRNASLTSIDSVKIIHASARVKMKIKGYLSYWKSETINTYDSSQVIAVLADEKQQVRKDDFLFSLWSLEEANEYTPEDIRAPFKGTIDKIFTEIGFRHGKNQPLAYIYSDDFLELNSKTEQSKIKYLKKNLQATIKLKNDTLSGAIKSVNFREQNVSILFGNPNALPPSYELKQAEIDCGNIRGEFIPARYFKNSKTIQVYIDDESTFTISKIGISDSLALIAPPLPQLSVIRILNRQSN